MFNQATPVEEKLPIESVVTVRDVVRGGTYRVLGREPMLRVPYDLYSPDGPVEYRGGVIHYSDGGAPRTGAVALAAIADARPGERILVRIPPRESDTEWWLCEVEARDGVVNE